MTWPELIWLISIPSLVLLGLYLECCRGECDAFVGCSSLAVLVFLCGGVIMLTNSQCAKYITTAEVEITPLSTTLSNDGLDVVTSDHQHYLFKSYDEVNRWKNGGKFYKQYQFAKVNFGPDGEKTNIIIKSYKLLGEVETTP